MGKVVAGGVAATPRRGAGTRQRTQVRFEAALARGIARRVASGEALSAVCTDAGMPTHGTVTRWAKVYPAFGRTLRLARQAAGWPGIRHPGPQYCEATAAMIYARMCEGEALMRICEEPGMPGHSTVYRWRRRFPDFAAALREARAVQAERYCEIGWEIADAVTPADAHAVRVKLEQLRWTAGAFGPRVFGRVKPVEGEMAEAVERAVKGLVVRARQFEKKQDADGRWYLEEVYSAAEQAVLDAGGTLSPALGSMRRVSEPPD